MDRFASRSLDDVLCRVAIPGTDPGPVAEYVIGALLTRRRRARSLGVAAALLALVMGAGALTLTGAEKPDEVVSAIDIDDPDSGDDPSPRSTAGSGSVVTAVPSTAAPATTSAGIAGFPTLPPGPTPSALGAAGVPAFPIYPGSGPAPAPAVPAVPGPGTAAVPDQPLTGTLDLAPTAVVAGAVTTVTLRWSDPDLAPGTAAMVELSTSPGGMKAGPFPSSSGPCLTGAGACGEVPIMLRFATHPAATISATVTVAGGAPVAIPPASLAVDQPEGRVVVVRLDGGDPEVGTWSFGGDTVRTDGEGTGVRQSFMGVPATVLVLPRESGTLSHEIPGCTRTVEVFADSRPPEGWSLGACT